MYRFWAVLADGSSAAVLLSVLVLYRVGKSRHIPRYAVPADLPNWHDVGPEAVSLRKRARWWRGFVLLRRALVGAGLYLLVGAWIGRVSGERQSSDLVTFLWAAALVAVGLSLTVPCRRLAHPMYSQPRGRAARRERHSLHGSMLRLGAMTLYYPFLVYVAPMVLVLMFVGAVSSVGGYYGPLGGLAMLAGIAGGLLALGGFTRLVRGIDQRGLRYRSADADRVLAEDERPHFLYLRTFQDDAVEIRASGTSRRGIITALSFRRQLPFEEVMAWRFQHYAPIIAGNDPNASGLATMGAAKLFLSLDPNFEELQGRYKWQQEIEDRARKSRAVLVSAAPMALQPGVKFELEMLGDEERMPEHPLVLIVPPDRQWSPVRMIRSSMNRLIRSFLPAVPTYTPERAVAERWSAFNDFVQDWPVFKSIRELNATGAAHLLVYVPGEGWSAWGAGRRSEWTYAVSIKQAMDYAYERWPAAPQQVTMPNLVPAHPPQAAPVPQQTAGPEIVTTPRGPRAIPDAVKKSVRLMRVAMAAFVPAALVDSATTSAGIKSTDPSPSTAGTSNSASFLEVLLFLLVPPLVAWLVIARRCLRGGNMARSAATVMFGLGCLEGLLIVGRVSGLVAQIVAVGFLAPALWSVVLLWRKDSSAYFEYVEPVADQSGKTAPAGTSREAHQLKWAEIPGTVRAAIVLMCGGAAMLTAQGYTVLYRVFHNAQAANAADSASSQLQQSASLVTVPFVAATFGVVLMAWIWVILECRSGRRRGQRRQRGRIAATTGFALSLAVIGWLSAIGSGVGMGRTLFVLVGLAAVVLLWLPQSGPHFVKPTAVASRAGEEPSAPAEPAAPAPQEAVSVPVGPLPWARTQRVAVVGLLAALFVNGVAQAGALVSRPTTRHSPSETIPEGSSYVAGTQPATVTGSAVTTTAQGASGQSAEPCPASGATASPPTGWSVDTGVTLTNASDPGAVCLTSPTQELRGMWLLTPSGPDYTVTIKGRLLQVGGDAGWYFAVRATLNANVEYGHNIVGHVLGYASGSYSDGEMFGTSTSPQLVPAAADKAWHVLSIAVKGNRYASSVDGRQLFAGALPLAEESGGGVFFFTSGGATVEIDRPIVASGG